MSKQAPENKDGVGTRPIKTTHDPVAGEFGDRGDKHQNDGQKSIGDKK